MQFCSKFTQLTPTMQYIITVTPDIHINYNNLCKLHHYFHIQMLNCNKQYTMLKATQTRTQTVEKQRQHSYKEPKKKHLQKILI